MQVGGAVSMAGAGEWVGLRTRCGRPGGQGNAISRTELLVKTENSGEVIRQETVSLFRA